MHICILWNLALLLNPITPIAKKQIPANTMGRSCRISVLRRVRLYKMTAMRSLESFRNDLSQWLFLPIQVLSFINREFSMNAVL